MPDLNDPFGDQPTNPAAGVDDPLLNPEHIENIPAGVKRAEERARRKDQLAQQAEEDAKNAGSIQSDALSRKEREILQHFDPETADIFISNLDPNWHYVWVHASATDHITSSRYERMGYIPIIDPRREAWEHRGRHSASYVSPTARSVGDVVLWGCPKEVHFKNEARQRHLADAMAAVEEAWEDDSNDKIDRVRPGAATAHGRRDDPVLRQTVFRGTAGQIERLGQQLKGGTVDKSWRQTGRE